MSSSIDTENELRIMAEKLSGESCILRDAADLLENIREQEALRRQEISNIKERVRIWLK